MEEDGRCANDDSCPRLHNTNDGPSTYSTFPCHYVDHVLDIINSHLITVVCAWLAQGRQLHTGKKWSRIAKDLTAFNLPGKAIFGVGPSKRSVLCFMPYYNSSSSQAVRASGTQI